ncbi:paxillin-like isoform X1 [Huso huso]|uniref:Paxillin n=1 Tax=Huso huso TaxID=61971 RepID=A0ABR0YUR7_HUSHU
MPLPETAGSGSFKLVSCFQSGELSYLHQDSSSVRRRRPTPSPPATTPTRRSHCPPPVPPPPSAEALNGSVLDPADQWQSPARFTPQQPQAVKSVASVSRESGSPPTSRPSEEDHVYSFPNKPKTTDPSQAAMSSFLGSNLSELDRLLLELNAVQHNPPSFATTEDTTPPLPSVSTTHYGVQENGGSAGKKAPPPAKEKPKRSGGRGIEDVRPSVESLLDELESSVPSPAPASVAVLQCDVGGEGQRDTPTQQQARISASSATRELDELMASLSDFKVQSNPSSSASLASEPFSEQDLASSDLILADASTPSPGTPGLFDTVPPNKDSSPVPQTPSPLGPLHIDEEGSGAEHPTTPLAGISKRDPEPAASPQPRQGKQTGRELDSDVIIDVSSSMLSSRLECLVVLDKPDPPLTGPQGQVKSEGRTRQETTASTLEPARLQGQVTSELCATSKEHEASLDEALDKLLAMGFEELEREDPHVEEEVQEIYEEAIVATDRREAFPDTAGLQQLPVKEEDPRPTPLPKGNREEEEKELREADRLAQQQSPEPEPTAQPPVVERISTSSQMKSLIKRTKETSNVHPMLREDALRRKLGPVIFHKSNSQDKLIEELQGKLGIGRQERWKGRQEDWLTEGVIVTSTPLRTRQDSGPRGQQTMFYPPRSRHPDPVTARPPPSPPTVDKFLQPLAPSPPHVPHQRAPYPGREDWFDFVDPYASPSPYPYGELQTLDPNIMAQGKGGGGSPPAGAPKAGNKLDSMLGSLQSDLNRLGVQTVAKGVCGACNKPIAGQVVTAMGRTWHPEHFVCTHCQEEIGSRNFFERDGQPYCERDYHNLFSPRCYYCNGPILDKVVTALDRTWHPEHFFCAQCGAFFGPEGFHEKDGKAYCRKDYFDMFAPKCGGCARAILENYISALNSLWHPECFVCRECFTPFVNGSFFEHDGQPYCEVHYHERRGSLCSGCQKPITGRCITAMAKKFHPEHFVCAFCLKQLNKGTFKEQNDKPYCQNCFIKLFS